MALYPVHIAHPFAKGEFTANPVPDIPGAQVNVKAKHDDGSCKHAWFYFILGGNPGQTGQINFVNTLTVNNQGMSLADMIAGCPDVEFQIWNADFSVMSHSVKLKDMLPSFTTVNAAGPVCTDITCHDPTGGFDGTFGPDGLFNPTGAKTIRPIWEVQFWPSIGSIYVTLVVETSNTTAVQESWYASRILVNGVKSYEHQWDVHPYAKKWFWHQWIGNPVREVAINHNIAHLAQSKAIPNYDPKIQLQVTAVTSMKDRYNASGLSDIRTYRDQTNAGMLMKAMSQAGTRLDLGVAAEWVIDYLYSGDQDLYHMMIEESERACNYSCFYRESANTFKGYGGAPRVDDRPLSDFLQPGKFTDGFEITGDADHQTDGWGWSITDRQHAPNPFYIPYLVTGKHYLLDCMLQWAGFWVGVTNGATTDNRGRGPTGTEGVIGLPGGYGTRGPAHILKQTAQTAWVLPDDSPYKTYFTTCILNSIAAFEGTHGITGTQFDGTPCKIWGTTVDNNINALAWWARPWANADLSIADPHFKPNMAFGSTAHWENSYMDLALGVCVDFEFPADALLAWRTAAWRKFSQAAMPGPLCVGLEPPTWIPTIAADQIPFSDPAQIVACFVDGYDWHGSFYNNLDSDKNHGYATLAIMAAASMHDKTVWDWYGPNAYDKTDWTGNPHWAILPRI